MILIEGADAISDALGELLRAWPGEVHAGACRPVNSTGRLPQSLEAEVALIVAFPLEACMTWGIRCLGQRLFELGGSHAMDAALAQALSASPDRDRVELGALVVQAWRDIGSFGSFTDDRPDQTPAPDGNLAG